MKVDFVRFTASDGVELQGWLSNIAGETAAIHIHGMSGNGYENLFLDSQREMYAKNNVSFFSIDTRGRGVVSSFGQSGKTDPWGEGTKLGGSCFEIFEESAADIQGAIDYLKTLGKTKFILQGHSLGCTKVVNYLVTKNPTDVISAVLLAPTDMTAWASTDPKHEEYLSKAGQFMVEGKGTELVGAQCWLDKTPISAQTYTMCESGSVADIYGDHPGGALLGKVQQPMLIAYGDEDIGIKQTDGSMDKYLERTNKIKNANTKISIIKGAPHNFSGHEATLTETMEGFIKAK